jgi:hypothetical protein
MPIFSQKPPFNMSYLPTNLKERKTKISETGKSNGQ